MRKIGSLITAILITTLIIAYASGIPLKYLLFIILGFIGALLLVFLVGTFLFRPKP